MKDIFAGLVLKVCVSFESVQKHNIKTGPSPHVSDQTCFHPNRSPAREVWVQPTRCFSVIMRWCEIFIFTRADWYEKVSPVKTMCCHTCTPKGHPPSTKMLNVQTQHAFCSLGSERTGRQYQSTQRSPPPLKWGKMWRLVRPAQSSPPPTLRELVHAIFWEPGFRKVFLFYMEQFGTEQIENNSKCWTTPKYELSHVHNKTSVLNNHCSKCKSLNAIETGTQICTKLASFMCTLGVLFGALEHFLCCVCWVLWPTKNGFVFWQYLRKSNKRSSAQGNCQCDVTRAFWKSQNLLSWIYLISSKEFLMEHGMGEDRGRGEVA